MGIMVNSFNENKKDYRQFLINIKNKGLVNYNNKLDYWGNIPIQPHFIKPLHDLFDPNHAKFLDLGCGVGNVLRFAQNIGYDVLGVEFDSELIKHLSDYKYLHADMTKLSDKFYKDFDVIYIYNPLKDRTKGYVNEITPHIKKGAYLVSPFLDIENPMVEPLGRYVHQKI